MPTADRPAPPAGTGLPKQRLETLCDGIFAIVMTLLIFELKVPVVHGADVDAELAAGLLTLGPKVLSLVVSFVILGIFWSGHHNQYHFISHTDRQLQWINVAFLLTIVFVPFTAGMIGSYPLHPLPAVLYGANLVLIGSALTWHWSYVVRNGLLVPDKQDDPAFIRLVFRRCLAGVVAYSIAIAAAFVHPAISLAIFVLMPLYYIIPNGIDVHWQGRRPASGR